MVYYHITQAKLQGSGIPPKASKDKLDEGKVVRFVDEIRFASHEKVQDGVDGVVGDGVFLLGR